MICSFGSCVQKAGGGHITDSKYEKFNVEQSWSRGGEKWYSMYSHITITGVGYIYVIRHGI